jgi:hypothetical protein
MLISSLGICAAAATTSKGAPFSAKADAIWANMSTAVYSPSASIRCAS